MEVSLILARTGDGKLWKARHYEGSPEWVWGYASEGETEIMGHLVLTIPAGTPMPSGPGAITSAMLPGATGEGAARP